MTIPGQGELLIDSPNIVKSPAFIRRVAVLTTLALTSLGISTSSASAEYDEGQEIPANSSICVDSEAGLPGDVAAVNITNTNSDLQGWGALRSSDATPVYNRPVEDQYSNVNHHRDIPPNPNVALVEVGTDGRYCYDQGPTGSHVILDELAIFPAGTVDAGDPTRVLDTRVEYDSSMIV